MRKITGFALIIFLTSTALFAQNLTFGGYLNSGLGLVMAGDEDPFLKVFGVDSESNGYRLRLNGNYQNEAKNAGFRLRLQSQRTLSFTSTGNAAAGTAAGTDDHTHSVSVSGNHMYLSVPYAYGFANFFDNKLSFSAGIVDDSTWQTADWWFNDDAGEGLGVLMKLNLIEGLSIGFGAYTVTQLSGGSNNVLARNINSRPYLEDAKYTIGASYTLKDVFYIGATFRTESKAGGDTKIAANAIDDARSSSLLVGDLRILAVKGLTAVIAVAADNLQDFNNSGLMFISETFAYKINDEFNLGLNAVQFLYQDARDMGMLFNLWGSYAFGIIVPRLDLVYFINGTSHNATTAEASVNPNYHRRGYVPSSVAAEYSVISIRPSVRINLDNRTHLEIGNVTHIDMAKENIKNWNDSGSRITNVFYLDVRWNF